ncbi:hypothetical protein [Clostridium disporicum]|uniref:hypothetical protein n=1 Tax=Clostridium disporicum TaxID=84024 RepID=UPI0034A2CA59
MDLNSLISNVMAYTENNMLLIAGIVLAIVVIIKIANTLIKTAFSVVLMILIIKFLMDMGILNMITQ